MKILRIIVFILLVLIAGEAIGAFSMHLCTLLSSPQALNDSQYPIVFLLWSSAGLIASAVMLSVIGYFGRLKPLFIRLALRAIVLYCILVVFVTTILEWCLIKNGMMSVSLFLVGFMPFLFVRSLIEFFWLFAEPLYLFTGMLPFVPLAIILTIVYSATPAKTAPSANPFQPAH